MYFFISIPQGTAWFSWSRQPDIHWFVQVVGEHGNTVCHWWFPVSLCFSSTAKTSALFLAQLTASSTLAEKGLAGNEEQRHQTALENCVYCPWERKLFTALGASKCNAVVATGWYGTEEWDLCSSVLRGRDAVESQREGCGRHFNI